MIGERRELKGPESRASAHPKEWQPRQRDRPRRRPKGEPAERGGANMALVSPAHLSRGVAAAVGHHLHRCFARSVTKDQCFWPTQHRRSARRCPCQLRECTLLVHLLTLLRPSILSSRPLCLQLGLAKHRFAWELRAKRGSARLAFPPMSCDPGSVRAEAEAGNRPCPPPPPCCTVCLHRMS